MLLVLPGREKSGCPFSPQKKSMYNFNRLIYCSLFCLVFVFVLRYFICLYLGVCFVCLFVCLGFSLFVCSVYFMLCFGFFLLCSTMLVLCISLGECRIFRVSFLWYIFFFLETSINFYFYDYENIY